MKYFLIILSLLFLIRVSPVFGILVSFAYLAYLIFRDRPGSAPDQVVDKWGRQRVMNAGDLADLAILRLEIDRLCQDGVLEPEQAESFRRQIDDMTARYLADCSAEPVNLLWRERRENAWSLLETYTGVGLGLPPWKLAEMRQDEQEVFQPEPALPEATETLALQTAQTAFVKELQEEAEPPSALAGPCEIEEEPGFEATAEEERLERQAAQSAFVKELRDDLSPAEPLRSDADSEDSRVQDRESDTGSQQDIQDYAWRPKEPGALEKTLMALSGWHAMAAPFLLQNIGWFIGVFCFIAGSVFLVSYSSGYAKNLFAFLMLFLFTLFSLWGGYQIRRKRPDLKTSSHVIFILSMLLIPLVTTTVINLLINSETIEVTLFADITLIIDLRWISGLLVAIDLAMFYYAVTMVSGLMDRSLQRHFPRFFLGLNAAQLLLLVLALWPYWPVAMLAHLAVFTILSFGIHAFINDWLRAIFIDRRKIAYFAAGTLIYAALIGFINFTWGTDEDIRFPAGYSGFFLMLLCGLLFYVDAHFKRWVDRQANLSRFSFIVYALSLLALFIEMPQQTMAIPTLCLAIALYAFVVWHYLTLTPLYIFLLCSFWLYGLLILQHFAPNLHFILASPGLYALYRAANRALTMERCAHLAVIVFRMLYGSLVLLAAWSLFHSESGWLGLANVLLACGLYLMTLASAPIWLFWPRAKIDQSLAADRYRNLLSTPWYYGIPLLTGAAVFYLPKVPGLPEAVQSGFASTALAIYWAYGGVNLFVNGDRKSTTSFIAMRLNSALLCLLMALSFLPVMPVLSQWLCLGLLGAVMLWLTLTLRVQGLFYLTLLAWGASGVLIKAHYFPAPSTGLVEMLAALSIWLLLGRLEGVQDPEIARLQQQAEQDRASRLPSFRLLGIWQINPEPESVDDD